MNFGEKLTVKSHALEPGLLDKLYPKEEAEKNQRDRDKLEQILYLFGPYVEQIDDNFTCFITKDSMQNFIDYANDVFDKKRHEASGLIVGYYLHNPKDPNKKIVVATDFLPASGDSTSVTCEFSYEDSIRHANYCEEHHVLPVVWIHSHPGFGVFYSGTDSGTLRTQFNCNHQVGVVVDNIQDLYKAFKIIDGEEREVNIWGYSTLSCLTEGKLSRFRYNKMLEPVVHQEPISFNQVKEKASSLQKAPISYTRIKAMSKTTSADLKIKMDELTTAIKTLKDQVEELRKQVKALQAEQCDAAISRCYITQAERKKLKYRQELDRRTHSRRRKRSR